jgi:citronellyl-CoA dehydrogenase
VRDREAFGRPRAANQPVAFQLAELSAKVDMLQSHNYQSAQAHMADEDITRRATAAKLAAGRLLREVADVCLQ